MKGAFWQSKALKETFNVNLNKISIYPPKKKIIKYLSQQPPPAHIAPMKDTQKTHR